MFTHILVVFLYFNILNLHLRNQIEEVVEEIVQDVVGCDNLIEKEKVVEDSQNAIPTVSI
jgi:hypothetical protein